MQSDKITILEEFFDKVLEELRRQDKEHGKEIKHPLVWQSLLIEEVGEVGKEINDNNFKEVLPQNYEIELVQVASCVFRMYERNNIKSTKKSY